MSAIAMPRFDSFCRGAIASLVLLFCSTASVWAQEPLPWKTNAQEQSGATNSPVAGAPNYGPGQGATRVGQSGGNSGNGYGTGSAYNNGPVVRNAPHITNVQPDQNGEPYRQRNGNPTEHYETLPPGQSGGDAYRAPRAGHDYQDRAGQRGNGNGYRGEPDGGRGQGGSYSQGEIADAGHSFFGSISQGLASAIEYTFQKSGRPNGYVLGEDAGGAFVAGLRYGEGRLYTRDAGTHLVYWQGPSLGYDFGGEGSKAMILVYNLRDPSQIYHRFGGVQGSAYLVGGVSIQYQKYGDVVLATIRSGVGLRLGASVGYLKYTRSPTWNPF